MSFKLTPGDEWRSGRLVSHLPSTVAALAAQMLAVSQQPCRARTLEGQPWVNEGRGATVVIHKEGLGIKTQIPTVRHWIDSTVCAGATYVHMQHTESKDLKISSSENNKTTELRLHSLDAHGLQG